MSHRQALIGLLPKKTRGRFEEGRAVVVASGIGGVWINVRHVVAKLFCLSVLRSAGRRSG